MSRKESERTNHLKVANLKMPAPSSFLQMAYDFSPEEETEEERSASGIFTSAQKKSDFLVKKTIHSHV